MCVSHFTQEFEDFVRATIVRTVGNEGLSRYLCICVYHLVWFYQNLQWAHHKEEVTELYTDYVTDLLSAHTFYLKPVLYMLVKNLMMPGKEAK